jgi:hypothetical protein
MERVNAPSTTPAISYLGINSSALSFWWPVGLGITWLVFYIIGGALYGAFNNCWAKPSTSWSDCVPLRQGSYAMISIASIIFIAWVIVLVLYIVKRKKNAPSGGPTLMMGGSNVQNQPVMEGVKGQAHNNIGEFCANCGTRVTSAFCTRCGAQPGGN